MVWEQQSLFVTRCRMFWVLTWGDASGELVKCCLDIFSIKSWISEHSYKIPEFQSKQEGPWGHRSNYTKGHWLRLLGQTWNLDVKTCTSEFWALSGFREWRHEMHCKSGISSHIKDIFPQVHHYHNLLIIQQIWLYSYAQWTPQGNHFSIIW